MRELEHKSAIAGGPPIFSLKAATTADRRRLSGPGLRSFLAIAEEWGLGEPERLQILGAPARSTYYNWIAGAKTGKAITLPLDALIRISALLGIYKALKIVFERDGDALAWLQAPNRAPLFGGQAPLDLITSGTQDGLMLVRRHLDAWRGGVFTAPLPEDGMVVPPLGPDDIVFVD